jgi:hypothetical protein
MPGLAACIAHCELSCRLIHRHNPVDEAVRGFGLADCFFARLESWARFLQILEDTGTSWVVSVLYSPVTQNITTRESLKNLLTANDPGDTVPFNGGLDELTREVVKCFKCGVIGHFARDCPNTRDCPKHWPDYPKEPGPRGRAAQRAPDVLSQQESSQDPYTLINALQNQVILQHQLLEVKTKLSYNDNPWVWHAHGRKA